MLLLTFLDDSDLKQYINISRPKGIVQEKSQGKLKGTFVSIQSQENKKQLSMVESNANQSIDMARMKQNRFSGFNIKPKFKKAHSVSKGSVSILLNVNDRKKRDFMNYQQDQDEEILKLTVCLRKEIPYEEVNMGENKMRFEKLSANNK